METLEQMRERQGKRDHTAYKIVGCVEAGLPYLSVDSLSTTSKIVVRRLRELLDEFDELGAI